MARRTRQRWTLLQQMRRRRGWSQADLASRLGISKPYMSQIESGARGLRNADLLLRIAELFDINVDELDASRPNVIYPNTPLPQKHDGRRSHIRHRPRSNGDNTTAGAA